MSKNNEQRTFNEYNDYYSTNEYLVSELILARKTNDLMEENNRRLENLLIKAIKDLRECDHLLNEMKFQVGELATIALKRFEQQ